jgi:hypothetical protein
VCCVLQPELSLPDGSGKQATAPGRHAPPTSVWRDGGVCKIFKTYFENNQSIWLGTPLNSPALESDWERAMADGRSLPFHFRLLLKMSTINFFICFVIFRLTTSSTSWFFSRRPSAALPFRVGLFSLFSFAPFRFG